MKKKLVIVCSILLAAFFTGCDSLIDEIDPAKEEAPKYSKLVIVNDTDVIMLSAYMRPVGSSSWGNNLLSQATASGNLPPGGVCTVNNIEFGSYDLHAYCYGNFYRYGVAFDDEEGYEWVFR